MRKSIPKRIREVVYAKYNGHCAYCGCELEYKDMQVDHIESVYRTEYHGKDTDNSIDNYNPACRACNFYKGTSTLEEFRYNIQNVLIRKLQRDFNYKLLVKYEMVYENFKPVKFFFEDYREDGET